jgi:penicillin-binding protein 2
MPLQAATNSLPIANCMDAPMRNFLRRRIPSMFKRRLVLLATAMTVGTLLLLGQLSLLTLVQAKSHRKEIAQALRQRKLIPTERGSVIDRHGRMLAISHAGYDVAVRYPVISGAWAYARARSAAYKQNRLIWPELSRPQREQLISTYEPDYERKVEQLWQTLCLLGHFDRVRLDEKNTSIKRRVQSIASEVWLKRLERQTAEMDEPVNFTDVDEPIGEHVAAHALIRDVDQQGLLRIQELIGASDQDSDSVWKQVSLKASKHRKYPLETMTLLIDRSTFPGPLKSNEPYEAEVRGVGLHIIGGMGPAYKEDVERRPFMLPKPEKQDPGDMGGILAGDRVGRRGVEKSMEYVLRGLRGMSIDKLDTRQQERLEPMPGQSVVLTIDIRLQARIKAVMDPKMGLLQRQRWHSSHVKEEDLGKSLNGAAVVLDVASGQVLAAVSMPGYSLEQMRKFPSSVFKDEVNKPYLFRPTGSIKGGIFQPGSVLKPLVLAASITDQVMGVDEHITCNGYLGYPDKRKSNRLRCWIYRHYNSTHGPLLGDEAISRSCNPFFYTLGRDMGAQRLVWWYDQFGLGRRTHCGLPEARGELPKLDPDGARTRGFSRGDGILMAIGQGPVRWTPLQAANAFATLARGGYSLSPTFIMSPSVAHQERESRDLGLDPQGLELVLKGMEGATNKRYGTAHHIALLNREKIFNVPNVKVYGKSGTATAVPLRIDSDKDGRITSRDKIVAEGDHAWFIGLAQKPRSARPDYVIAVVVEFAGSGGAVSGPIANQIMHALRAEGYL